MSALPELALRLLREGKNFATVATLMADGAPQASAVWIDTDGEHVIFNTAEGRLKPKNLRRDPRVAVSVVNAEQPYQQVMIRGKAIELTHDGADDHIDKLAKKYLGVDKYPFRQPGEERVMVKIAAEKIATMDVSPQE
jgi:PPOX class probable F420-dependent enzyme